MDAIDKVTRECNTQVFPNCSNRETWVWLDQTLTRKQLEDLNVNLPNVNEY